MANINTHLVQNHSVARICSVAGISLASRQLSTFKDLQNGLKSSLAELNKQNTRAEFIDSAMLVARFTKATCDAVLDLASALSPGSRKIAEAYKVASATTTVVATAATGAKVDYVSSGLDIAKAGASYIPEEGGAQYLTKNFLVKAKIVKGALNSDMEEIKKSSVEYGKDLGEFTLDAMDAKKSKAFFGLGTTIFEYHETITRAFDDAIGDKQSTADRFTSGKAIIRRQAQQLDTKVTELEKFIDECNLEFKVVIKPR